MSSFCKSYSHSFSKNIIIYAIFNDQICNDMLTHDIVSFEQLGPENQLSNVDPYTHMLPLYIIGSIVYSRAIVYIHQDFLKIVVHVVINNK